MGQSVNQQSTFCADFRRPCDWSRFSGVNESLGLGVETLLVRRRKWLGRREGQGKDVWGKAFGLFQNLMGEILGEFQLGRNTTLAC